MNGTQDNAPDGAAQATPVALTSVPHLITQRGVTAFINNKQYVAEKSHPNYSAIVEALRNRTFDILEELFDVALAFQRRLQSIDPDFRVSDGIVFLNNRPFPERVSRKAIDMLKAGASMEGLLNFLRKLRLNPSFSSQNELLDFCEANSFLIHEDGDILAYKGVTGSFMDCHTKTVINKPFALMTPEEVLNLPASSDAGVTTQIEGDSTVVTMERAEVDDDRKKDCSYGLHAAAYEYARGQFGNGGNRLLLVKINPRDVVSVPQSYSAQKLRCCRYEIVAELSEKNPLAEKQVYANSDIGR